MRLQSGYEDRKVRVELLPLMDVMFLLLLVFVYASFAMTIHRGLKVALPTSQGTLLQGERIVITLSADDSLALNREPMPLAELLEATYALWQQNGQPVLISADRAASLGVGIELLGQLKTAGVTEVAFQVESEKTP